MQGHTPWQGQGFQLGGSTKYLPSQAWNRSDAAGYWRQAEGSLTGLCWWTGFRVEIKAETGERIWSYNCPCGKQANFLSRRKSRSPGGGSLPALSKEPSRGSSWQKKSRGEKDPQVRGKSDMPLNPGCAFLGDPCSFICTIVIIHN